MIHSRRIGDARSSHTFVVDEIRTLYGSKDRSGGRVHQTLGIVQPRGGAPPWNDLLARKLGGYSWLAWVVHRLADCQRLDRVIVVIGDSPDERALAELVPPNVPVVVGQRKDVLSRFVTALDEFPAHAVVRVCADSPLIDPVLIDRLVADAEGHPRADYISYSSRDGSPVVQSSLGILAEWCRASSLRRADREALDPLDRAEVTRFLYTHPERFQVRLLPAPPQLDREDVRLALNFAEDWERAETIFETLGPDRLDWRRVAGLVDR